MITPDPPPDLVPTWAVLLAVALLFALVVLFIMAVTSTQ